MDFPFLLWGRRELRAPKRKTDRKRNYPRVVRARAAPDALPRGPRLWGFGKYLPSPPKKGHPFDMHTKSWTDFWRCISLASVFFIGRNTFGPSTDSGNTARRSVGVLPNREVRRSMKKYFPQGGRGSCGILFSYLFIFTPSYSSCPSSC